jgi:hypothetical protein
MTYVVIEMCYLRVQDNIKFLPKTTDISSFINYANALFIVAGIFIFFYILFHAVFSIKYWALSRKVENLLKKEGNEKQFNRQAIIIFSIILITCVTGVVSMTYE